MLIVKLPFPAAELFPNRKNGQHWAKTNSEKVGKQHDGYCLTEQAMDEAGPQEWPEHIPLSLTFVMPDKRHRDSDNMLAASKALLDGMADALEVNDRRFRPILVDWVHGSGECALIAAVGASRSKK